VYRAYLESLPGFGKIFAPIVALEIDDPKRFADAGNWLRIAVWFHRFTARVENPGREKSADKVTIG